MEVSVSDGTASDSQAFTVTVTNDTSDDPVTSNYDGVLIRDGYIQSATVCIPVTDSDGDATCEGATYTTTTSSDGSFSLEVDDNALSSTSNENDPSEEVVVVYVAPSQVASPSESVTGIHTVADWI